MRRPLLILATTACMAAIGMTGAGVASATAPPLCDGVPATMVVQAGAQGVTGTSGRDVIFVVSSQDQQSHHTRIDARAGDDVVCGGNGIYDADHVLGGPGNDRIFGGAGRDVLEGQDGADMIRGGVDDDSISGDRFSNDVPPGDRSRDVLYGEAGNDILHIDGGADTVHAGEGNDSIQTYDHAGDDYVDAGGGYDVGWLDQTDNWISIEEKHFPDW